MNKEYDSFMKHLSKSKERIEEWPEWKKESLSASKNMDRSYLDEKRRRLEDTGRCMVR